MAVSKNKLDAYFKELGALVAKFRKKKKYSLEELGMRIGLDRSSMHRIENGKHISVTTIIKLSLALDKKPRSFLDIPFDFKPQELDGLVKPKKTSKKKVKSKGKK